MENTTKSLITIFAIIIFSCSHKESNYPNGGFISIKDGILFSKNDTLYVQIDGDFHPEKKNTSKTTFVNYVFEYSTNNRKLISEVLDTKTFSRIEKSNYYIDVENYYFRPYRLAGNHYFNYIPKRFVNKLSIDNDSLFTSVGIFYKGVKL